MTAFAREPECSTSEAIQVQRPLLGYIQSQDRGGGDRVLSNVADRLIAEGTRVYGVVQVNRERRDGQRCDMDIRILPDGPEIRVSQSLGLGARGCRLDSGALEAAAARVGASFGPNADLLIVNKFGKQEASGAGFRTLIGDAITLGVPVLTCVNALNQEAFGQFSAGLQVRLEACETALVNWYQTSRQNPCPSGRAHLDIVQNDLPTNSTQ
jgi:nucleoside-triphosphatase THEP1